MSNEEFIEYIKFRECYKDKDGGWSCDGDLDISELDLTSIPVKFNIINGGFYCSCNKLTSLYNCPHEVRGDFSCSDNELTSLKYCPKIVHGHFWCYSNNLINLKDCPHEVGGVFSYYDNPIKDYYHNCKVRNRVGLH